MMEVVWKSSMFGGYFIWIGLLVLYGLLQCIVSTDKTSLACVGKPSCNMMALSCGEQHRISVMGHQYNYNESNQCTLNTSDSGCVIKEGCKRQFRKWDVYALYTSCSGLNTCTVAATSSKYNCTLENRTEKEVKSDSTNVTYRCVNDRDILRFCKNRSITTPNSVDIIFNGTDTNTYVRNQTCTCTVIGSSTDPSVVLQDFRLLQPDNTSVCSSVKIKGYGKTCDATKDQWRNFVYLQSRRLRAITLENLFAKGSNDRPTMVWIRVNAGGSAAPLTVNCTGPVPGKTTPTVGSPSTTKPSSGSATSTTTETSSGSATSTTAPFISTNTGTSVGGTVSSSSASPNHARVNADENKVPVAAIVVPLLLVLLGSTAAVMSVWFWRKRRKAATGKNTNISNGQHNVTYVSSGVSSGRISGTDGTYDFPEEDEYSTIDGNGLAKSSCESDNDGYAVPADAVRADDTTEYDVATLQSKHVLLDPSYARLQGTSTNKVLSTQADDYSHIPLTTRSAQINLDRPNDVSYSHLQGPPTATQRTTEYSHINASDAANGTDEYSHLQVTKPPNRSLGKLPDDEEDTYDHTSSGGAMQHAEQIPVSLVTGLSPLFSHTAASFSGKQEVPVDDDGGEEHAYFTLEKVDQQ